MIIMMKIGLKEFISWMNKRDKGSFCWKLFEPSNSYTYIWAYINFLVIHVEERILELY